MLEQENEGLRERVSTLEKKVRQQEDEIVCLKSALADVIRKITVLENTRGMSNNNISKSESNRGGKYTFRLEKSIVVLF